MWADRRYVWCLRNVEEVLWWGFILCAGTGGSFGSITTSVNHFWYYIQTPNNQTASFLSHTQKTASEFTTRTVNKQKHDEPPDQRVWIVVLVVVLWWKSWMFSYFEISSWIFPQQVNILLVFFVQHIWSQNCGWRKWSSKCSHTWFMESDPERPHTEGKEMSRSTCQDIWNSCMFEQKKRLNRSLIYGFLAQFLKFFYSFL